MKKKPITMPEFANEAEEAGWWASRQGREFVKQNAAPGPGTQLRQKARAWSGNSTGRPAFRSRCDCLSPISQRRANSQHGRASDTRRCSKCWSMKVSGVKHAGAEGIGCDNASRKIPFDDIVASNPNF